MKYLSVKQMAIRYGVCVATIWNWVNKGALPEPVRFSTKCTRWNLADIEAWEAAQ